MGANAHLLCSVDHVIRIDTARGAPGGGGLPSCSLPPKPPKTEIKKKKPDFVDIMVSKFLCDMPFGRNQPLKSADD
jgi:hypothetical protein